MRKSALYMTDKLIVGVAAYRKKNGRTQWLIVKGEEDSGWELPKGEVKKAESSVRAALRHLRDEVGVRGKVLEEAGRATVSTTADGEPLAQKLIFYLMRQRSRAEKLSGYSEEKWLPYSAACRSLSLARERRILRQANETLKEWRKVKRD